MMFTAANRPEDVSPWATSIINVPCQAHKESINMAGTIRLICETEA